MVCKICGNKISAGETKCDFCGSPVIAEASEYKEASEIKKQSTESTDTFSIENILDAEKTEYDDKKEASITKEIALQNKEEEPFLETQFEYESEDSYLDTETVSNANDNTSIYVLLSAIVALAFFIVLILVLTQ